jgi:hypothetical protein
MTMDDRLKLPRDTSESELETPSKTGLSCSGGPPELLENVCDVGVVAWHVVFYGVE